MQLHATNGWKVRIVTKWTWPKWRPTTRSNGYDTLWVILELALMATDLAEVFPGSAIALNLALWDSNYGCHFGDSPWCVFPLLLIMKLASRKSRLLFHLIWPSWLSFVYLVALSEPSITTLEGYSTPALFEPHAGHKSQPVGLYTWDCGCDCYAT